MVLELGRLQKLNSFNGLRFAVWLGSNYGTHIGNSEEPGYRSALLGRGWRGLNNWPPVID